MGEDNFRYKYGPSRVLMGGIKVEIEMELIQKYLNRKQGYIEFLMIQAVH